MGNSQFLEQTVPQPVTISGTPTVINGSRARSYQRVGSSAALSMNGWLTYVISTGPGTKALNVAFKSSGGVVCYIAGCDNSGTALGGNWVAQSPVTSNGALVVTDWGGAPYVAILIKENDGVAQTLNFIDVNWTLA